MINSLLNAITKQLGTKFGKNYHYYVEGVEQNLVTPCFTARLLLPLSRSRSPVLYDRTMPIVIHYFSDSKDDLVKDCYSVGEQLFECLEYLPFQGKILRGKNMSLQIVDDVLQVFVTYTFMTAKEVDETSMLELEDFIKYV